MLQSKPLTERVIGEVVRVNYIWVRGVFSRNLVSSPVKLAILLSKPHPDTAVKLHAAEVSDCIEERPPGVQKSQIWRIHFLKLF